MTTRITIRKWLASKNGLPRVVDVEVFERTQKAIHVKGHAAVEQPVHCCICGRDLTHPVSQQVGIGPICCEKLGIDWSADTSPEAIAALKARLVTDTEFETWLPLSQIEAEDDLSAVPQKAHEDKPKPEGVGSLVGAEGRMATLDITPWIAEQKGFAKSTTKVRGKIKRASDKAVLVQVKYSYHPITEDDRNFMKLTDSTPADFDQVWTDDEKRMEYPARKSFCLWFPVSQITDADIDEPRKAPVRRSIRHEKVEPTEHVPTEYEKQCEEALKALGV